MKAVKTETRPRWHVAPEVTLERLSGLLSSKEAVAMRVPPMSDGWMRKKGYILGPLGGLRIRIRVGLLKLRIRARLGDGRA